MSLTEQILSQLPGDALGGLRKVDRLWQNLKQNTAPIPQAVKHSQQPLETLDFDIVISGGTLGILIGTALAVRGWRVALLERGILRGRDQEIGVLAAQLPRAAAWHLPDALLGQCWGRWQHGAVLRAVWHGQNHAEF